MDDVIEFVNRGDIVKKLTQENNLHPIAEKIFQMLDQKSLVLARGVSRTWKNYVDKETSFWDGLPTKKYLKAVKDERLDIFQNLVDYAKDKNPCDPYYYSVMHYAALKGKTNVMKILLRNAKNKNPPVEIFKWTPLHVDARAGQLNMCKLILKNTDDKKPKTWKNNTPIELAQRGRQKAIDEGKNEKVPKYDAIIELFAPRRKSARIQRSCKK